MADTAIAITAGSGTNVDTRTEATNGNHRQVIVVGDPSTNAGVAPVDATAGLKVDLGTDNDITGTVTANLGATDNAVLDSIDTAVNGTLTVDLGANNDVTVTSGTVTANLGATDNAVLDSIDSATSAIQTAVETIDNSISGTETQVDVVASLPAGDNNIGNVDLASAIPAGTNAIGSVLPPDIDVTAHTNYAKKYYTSTGAATDGIIWSPAAGKRWHVVSMYIQTSAAATITLEDDKAGGDEAIWKGEFTDNQGMTINFGEKYPLASGEDAADLTVTTSAGNIYITVTGYEV